jgi:ABC-2 type transport system ATP-binding protein
MAELAISTAGLTKDYGSGRGVFDLDLDIPAGEVFGFIGPNGAGKTTTIRLLMDLVRPTSGNARLLGLDSHVHAVQIKRQVGYVPGELPTYPGATAAQIIGLLAAMRGGVDDGRILELARRLDLDLSRRYRDLSHGNNQKVWRVQAMMHRPRLLILDEPTLGLDPLVQEVFEQLIREACDAGATVFLSSHVLSEVQQLCHRMALVRAGRLLRAGTLAELRELRLHRVEATYTGSLDTVALAAVPGIDEVQVDDHHLRCTVHGAFAPLIAALTQAEVLELDSQEMTLDEIFHAAYRDQAQ